jgi:hypothetical protein
MFSMLIEEEENAPSKESANRDRPLSKLSQQEEELL